MVLLQEPFTGYAIPERSVWAYVYAARMPDTSVPEVVLRNGDGGESFAHVADHLPWEGYGSVKSRMLAVPRS